MTSNITEEFLCPICIETLERPIRMLTCGHNFCHKCLVRFYKKNQNQSCPTCRIPIAFPSNGVDEISRNITLENVIERLGKMKVTSQTVEAEVLTPSKIKQLQDSAATYQQQSNFQKAVETLQIIIDHVEGWDKLQPSIDQAECLLNLEKIPEAEIVCVSIASIVDANQSSRLTDQSRDVYDENIKKLVLKFVNVKECDCAISLAHCRFQFVKNHYDGESGLDKLQNVGWLMEEISEELSKQNKQEQIKQQYSFIDEILDFMENMNNVDLKIKCIQICWFLKHFRSCSDEASDYYKSIALNTSAITVMKTVFTVEANRYRVFAYCHHNMGLALSNTDQLFEAKAAFTKAIEIYNTVNDWPSEEIKSTNILMSKNDLGKVEEQISQI